MSDKQVGHFRAPALSLVSRSGEQWQFAGSDLIPCVLRRPKSTQLVATRYRAYDRGRRLFAGDGTGMSFARGQREIDMSSYGSVIVCPECGADHIVRVGEIKNERRLEFTCPGCGAKVVLENETRPPAVHKKGRWDK